MSEIGEEDSLAGHDTEHQTAYVYVPASVLDKQSTRPTKKRKIGKTRSSISDPQDAKTFGFEPLLEGFETPQCIAVRQAQFERFWGETEGRIQSALDEANEDTLAEVTDFVNASKHIRSLNIATGFVVTGPNITSQGLLFKQLSIRLGEEVGGPVVTLRSGDASNLKAVLKKVIRDGRKLLNYDLEIIHGFIQLHDCQAVVVAFQDSEAFDSNLLAELISIFGSWKDRIPFVLLFGIATSIDLFHERLPRAASRCLEGRQFNVEQINSLLERIFLKAVAGAEAALRLGAGLLSTLLDRQEDHVQSIQSFIAALKVWLILVVFQTLLTAKYAYMCHFYGNPLSILTGQTNDSSIISIVQPQHLELLRMLPSFKKLTENLVGASQLTRVRGLLEDENLLRQEVSDSLASGSVETTRILRTMHLVASCSSVSVSKIELYIALFQGNFIESEYIRSMIDSIKRMGPEDLVEFLRRIISCIEEGSPEMDLEGWADDAAQFVWEISSIQSQIFSLLEESKATGKSVRSSYAIHSKGVRTTVIAQRVQLSYENSTLSQQDKEFTGLVDSILGLLLDHFSCGKPQDIFLNEIWLFNSASPYTDYFSPRPRTSIERALSAPFDYLNCACCDPSEGLSSNHPATAILYQMYLETGSLINIFDLWSAFFEMISGGDDQKIDERDALVLFYKALADLKSLGMVRQSKKKANHLAKVAWKGL
ncbi:origin recognition complex subunit [Diplocarpon rosae]|nr:origin recognition complex subunit [Diplocarpon rosae]